MRWHNPVRRVVEEVPAPMSDAQAIELLSGHPGSDEFIEEYRRWRATKSEVVGPWSSRERRSTWSTGGGSPQTSRAPIPYPTPHCPSEGLLAHPEDEKRATVFEVKCLEHEKASKGHGA